MSKPLSRKEQATKSPTIWSALRTLFVLGVLLAGALRAIGSNDPCANVVCNSAACQTCVNGGCVTTCSGNQSCCNGTCIDSSQCCINGQVYSKTCENGTSCPWCPVQGGGLGCPPCPNSTSCSYPCQDANGNWDACYSCSNYGNGTLDECPSCSTGQGSPSTCPNCQSFPGGRLVCPVCNGDTTCPICDGANSQTPLMCFYPCTDPLTGAGACYQCCNRGGTYPDSCYDVKVNGSQYYNSCSHYCD
jgi:hypothetical protein